MTNKNIYMSLGGLDPELIMKAAPAEKVQKKKHIILYVKNMMIQKQNMMH